MAIVACKIYPLDELRDLRCVLAHGTFDLFHIGHLKYLKAAKSYGPLAVTLTAGSYIRNHGPGRPVFTDEERLEMIDALGFVNYVSMVYDETALPAIRMIKPRLYCKGDETRREGNSVLEQEIAAVKEGGGDVVFIPKLLPYSSGALLSGKILDQRIYADHV